MRILLASTGRVEQDTWILMDRLEQVMVYTGFVRGYGSSNMRYLTVSAYLRTNRGKLLHKSRNQVCQADKNKMIECGSLNAALISRPQAVICV